MVAGRSRHAHRGPEDAVRDPHVHRVPRFSWDGRRIAFFGNSSTGDAHLFVLDADGSNLTPVTTAKGEMNVMPQWASDDSALFYYQVRPSLTFRRIAMMGGTSEEIARWRWDREHEAATDPSSGRIVYSVLEQGRIQQTRVRRLEDGRETVLPAALFEPRFSRDGRFIAGESSDRAVVVCEIAGVCRPMTPSLRPGVTSIGWSADGSRVFYLQQTSQAGWGELKSVGVSGGVEQAHGSFGPIRPFEMLSTCRRATRSCSRPTTRAPTSSGWRGYTEGP